MKVKTMGLMGLMVLLVGGYLLWPAHHSRQVKHATLVAIGEWNHGYSYQFDDLASCTISDGNLAFSVRGDGNLTVTGVSLISKKSSSLNVSFKVLNFSPNATTGEIATSKTLTAMAAGAPLAQVHGRVVFTSHDTAWHFIVIQADVIRNIAHPWTIDGAMVTYVSRGVKRSILVKQKIVLPRANDCARPHSAA